MRGKLTGVISLSDTTHKLLADESSLVAPLQAHPILIAQIAKAIWR